MRRPRFSPGQTRHSDDGRSDDHRLSFHFDPPVANLKSPGVCGATGMVGWGDRVRRRLPEDREKRSLGLTGAEDRRATLVGVAVSVLLFTATDFKSSLYVPFFKNLQPDLTVWGYSAFIILVLTSTSNTVNLTDGLDGLAISVTAWPRRR